VKVLRRGAALPRWPVGARASCPVCGGEYELEAGDPVRLNEAQDEARFLCPNCGEILTVAKGA
jgi:rubredoxin